MKPQGPKLLISGAALLGVGLLGTGAVSLVQANTVPGMPVAAAHTAPMDDGHQYPAGGESPAALSKPPAAPPSPAKPAPKPAPVSGKVLRGGQQPGTIRLAHGGTANLVRAEVTTDGTLPIPNGVREATWWGAGLGASSGASLFAGHINWSGQSGPFDELWQSKVGDVATVRDTSGKVWSYRITKVLTLNKNDLSKQAPALFSQSGPHRAVLVTCGGRWVGGAEGYDSNRIVVATPI